MQNKKAKVKITLNDVKKGLSLNVLRLQGRSHLFLLLEQNLNPEDQDTKEILINNLANITFIHKDINSEIEDKLYEYLNDYIDSAKRHFIPTDSNLWKIEQYTTFLEYRITQIYLAGKEIFGGIFE
ncbi:DUF1524 domain-containing protein [Peptococcaceae bacterium]|nr:DUF1524 domain-containing protein [Peptococcaceae bacterium]